MQRRAVRHADEVLRCARTGYQPSPRTWLPQAERQRVHLRLVRSVQLSVLALLHVAKAYGRSVREVAQELGMGPNTLHLWARRWRDLQDRLRPKIRGAPEFRCTLAQRRDVHRVIDMFSTEISTASLSRLFPEIARRELARILHGRCAELWQELNPRRAMRAVRWSGVGKVWAMDFTELDQPDTQGRRYVLVVRDLASRCILATDVYSHADHQAVLITLERLIRIHGPPLVIKADNGSHFRNAEVEALLEAKSVIPLWSPPYYPRFNAAIESGIGRWKDRLRIIVGRDDHALGCTEDHVEGARLLANATGEASDGIPPSQWWEGRQPIAPEARADFLRWVRNHRQRIQDEMAQAAAKAAEKPNQHGQHSAQQSGDAPQPSIANPQPDEITWTDAAQRRAVVAALAEAGVVHIRSRRVQQPLSGLRSA